MTTCRYGKSLKVYQRDDSARIDLELLCSEVLETMQPTDNGFLRHKCDVPGCKEGFLMADGIEKVSVYFSSLNNT